MENIIDEIHEMVKDNPEYKNLSLDQRGEFCMKCAELLIITLEDKS